MLDESSKVTTLHSKKNAAKGILYPLASSVFLFAGLEYYFTQQQSESLALSPWILYSLSFIFTSFVFVIAKLPFHRKGLLAFFWPLLSLAISGMAIGVLLLLLAEVFPSLQDTVSSGSPIVALTLNALVYVVALLIIMASLYRVFFTKDRSPAEVFAVHRRPVLKNIGFVMLAFVAYFVTSALVTSLAGALLPFVDTNQQQDLGLSDPSTVGQLVILFIMLVIVAPIAEELILRGFMFSALRQYMSFWPTALLVSIAFGLAHGQWNVGIDTFVLSMYLSALREYTGTLWTSILLHALKNFLAFSLLFLYPDFIDNITQSMPALLNLLR